MCGEHHARNPRNPVLLGSSPHVREHMCPALSSRSASPHVRGTSAYSPRDYQPTRFIPACAGNIVATNSHMARLTVHPRMCGEHPTMQICTLDISGSSPHVRGTYICNAHANRSTRFIPACAGNILYILDCHIPFTVHPRMCGEHFIASSLTFSNSGSSPHVRGTHPQTATNRFIPACAAGGEHELYCQSSAFISGSSPHVRGTFPLLLCPVSNYPVHPRMCGEHSHPLIFHPRLTGSSPACAGNIYKRKRRYEVIAVHPRMCGGTFTSPSIN